MLSERHRILMRDCDGCRVLVWHLHKIHVMLVLRGYTAIIWN